MMPSNRNTKRMANPKREIHKHQHAEKHALKRNGAPWRHQSSPRPTKIRRGVSAICVHSLVVV